MLTGTANIAFVPHPEMFLLHLGATHQWEQNHKRSTEDDGTVNDHEKDENIKGRLRHGWKTYLANRLNTPFEWILASWCRRNQIVDKFVLHFF